MSKAIAMEQVEALQSATRVFVSYSRPDSHQVDSIVDELSAFGLDMLIDRSSILPGEPWKERLNTLIAKADSVLFFISPASIASSVCDWEINESERLGKSIVPVVIADVDGDLVPQRLKRLNYLFMRSVEEVERETKPLHRALIYRSDWIRQYNQLISQAFDWEKSGYQHYLLLRSAALDKAEVWLSEAPDGELFANKLLSQYLGESRRQARLEIKEEQSRQTRLARVQRRASLALLGISVLLLLGSGVAIFQSHKVFEREAKVMLSLAGKAMQRGNNARAMRLAVHGLPAKGDPPWHRALDELEIKLAGADLQSQVVYELSDAGNDVGVLSLSSDGTVLATGSDGTRIKLYDAQSARLLRTIDAHNANLTGLRFLPGDKRLVSYSRDSTVKVWDVETGLPITELRGHTGAVWDVATNDDGSLLASVAQDQTVRVWDVTSGGLLNWHDEHSERVDVVDFGPNGKFVLSGSWGGDIVVWDSSVAQTITRFSEHDDFISSAVFLSDGVSIVSISHDGTVHHWDFRTGEILETIEAYGFLVDGAVGPSEQTIVTSSGNGDIVVWSLDAGEELRVMADSYGHYAPVFSADGRRLTALSETGELSVWDTDSGARLANYAGRDFEVTTYVFTSSGQHLVSVYEDGAVTLLETNSFNFVFHEGDSVRSAAVNRDNTILYTVSESGNLYAWDVKKMALTQVISAHKNAFILLS